MEDSDLIYVQGGARDGGSLSARRPYHARFAAEVLDEIASRAAGLTADEGVDRLRAQRRRA